MVVYFCTTPLFSHHSTIPALLFCSRTTPFTPALFSHSSPTFLFLRHTPVPAPLFHFCTTPPSKHHSPILCTALPFSLPFTNPLRLCCILFSEVLPTERFLSPECQDCLSDNLSSNSSCNLSYIMRWKYLHHIKTNDIQSA